MYASDVPVQKISQAIGTNVTLYACRTDADRIGVYYTCDLCLPKLRSGSPLSHAIRDGASSEYRWLTCHSNKFSYFLEEFWAIYSYPNKPIIVEIGSLRAWRGMIDMCWLHQFGMECFFGCYDVVFFLWVPYSTNNKWLTIMRFVLCTGHR